MHYNLQQLHRYMENAGTLPVNLSEIVKVLNSSLYLRGVFLFFYSLSLPKTVRLRIGGAYFLF